MAQLLNGCSRGVIMRQCDNVMECDNTNGSIAQWFSFGRLRMTGDGAHGAV